MMEIWWNLPTRLCLCNKNPHCFRECLRTPTRTAKYCVNSLRSFIRSSLEHMRSVIQKTTMLLILTLVANLSNGALLKTTFALLCISHSHFRKCLPFQHSVFLVETKIESIWCGVPGRNGCWSGSRNKSTFQVMLRSSDQCHEISIAQGKR